MKRIEFAFIGQSSEIKERCEALCKTYDYYFEASLSVDDLFEKETTFASTKFFLLSALDIKNTSEVAGMVQILRQISPDSFCCVCVESKISPDKLDFIKKSGANLLILETEILTTSKIEYAANQAISSSYIPIKISELYLEHPIDFNLFITLPLNRKFILFARSDTKLDPERINQLQALNELYIKREEYDAWLNYIKKYGDNSRNSLEKRCRAQFLSLSIAFSNLVLAVSDQSEYTSFAHGKVLYDKCYSLASDLLTNLSALGSAWEIINQSALNNDTPIDRSPAIACYAGLMCLELEIADPLEVMIAALVSDIGLLELPPKPMIKLREGLIAEMHPEDLNIYKHHPVASLNQLLSRKVPVPERMKSIILNTHEFFNQKGFPNHPRPEKIPLEAYLIQACQLIDEQSLIKLGRARKSFPTVQKEFFQQRDIQYEGHFPMVFLLSLKKAMKLNTEEFPTI